MRRSSFSDVKTMDEYDPRRTRCFSDTFVTTVPKSSLYAFTQSSKQVQFVSGPPLHRHRCCHITKWVLVIAIVETFALAGSLLASIIEFADHSQPYAMESFVVDFVACCAGGFVVALMLVGLYKERYTFLLPHMICQVLAMIGFVIAIIIYSVEAGTLHGRLEYDKDHDEQDAKEYQSRYDYVVTVIVLCVAGLVVEVGFYAQVSKCYRYLKEKKVRRMHLVRRRSSV